MSVYMCFLMERAAFCILITIQFGTVFCELINCYNCIGDSCGDNVAYLQLVACPQHCCYAATTKNSTSTTNIRGCMDTGLTCNKFCGDLRLNSTGKDTLYCKSCSDSLCNDDELIKTIQCYQCSDCKVVTSTLVDCIASDGCYVDEGEIILRGCVGVCKTHNCKACNTEKCNSEVYPVDIPIKCYNCGNCNVVQENTSVVTCPKANCCYSAVVNDGTTERDCYIPKSGETCEDTCKQSKFIFCESCEDGDNCNNIEFDPPETNCYDCTNCNVVGGNTSVIKCPANCCYTTIVKKGANRGCFSKNCEHACESITKHDKSIQFCRTCNGGLCNHHPVKLGGCYNCTVPKPILCYECRHCDTVGNSKGFNKVVCSEPQCCYRALVTDRPEDVPFAIRGCVSIQAGETCRNACAYVKRDHFKKFAGGTFEFCMTCDGYSGDDCNWNDFGVTINRITNCYDCRDCDSVSRIKTIACASRCCYSAVLQGTKRFYSERGCVSGDVDMTLHACGRFCGKFRKDHMVKYPTGLVKDCEVCSTNNCNSRVIQLKPRIPLPIDSAFKCYVCEQCYTSPDESYLQFCPNDCCYTLISTEDNRDTRAERRCVYRNDTYKCENYCLDKKRSVEKGFKKNIVHECNSCGTSGCNNEVYTKPRSRSRERRETSINCYSCRDCETVDGKTITMDCPSSCCYSTMLQLDSGEYITERRCARTTTARLCHKQACRTARILHHMEYPKGKLFDCVMCSTDLCNSRDMVTPNATALLGGPVSCYVCVGCYSVKADTIRRLCATQCCYTVLWTEFSGTNIARLCATQECTHHPCTAFAEEIRGDSRSLIHHCESCRSNECNTVALKKPRIPRVRCYHCKDCTIVTADTHIVYCPRECCYTAIFQFGDELVTKRSCAKALHTVRKCIDYCAWIEERNRVKRPGSHLLDCEMCSTNRCNYRRLFAAKLTKPPRHDFGCYQCIGCYTKKPEIILHKCPSNATCCIAKVQSDATGTNSMRGCVELINDQKCLDYCDTLDTPKPSFCKTCDVSGCNTWKMYRAIRCYECENCTNVDATTTKVKCASNCCYSTLLKYLDGHYSNTRSCAKPNQGNCRSVCKTVHDQFNNLASKVNASDCEVCSKDKCNNRDMFIPPNPPKPAVFKCYQCVGCYIVDEDDVTVECPDECCCATVWTQFGGTNSDRRCIKLKVINDETKEKEKCEQSCKKIDKVTPGQTKTITEQFSCEESLCNSRELHRTITHINCYSCNSDVCFNINTQPCTCSSYACPTDCCYSTIYKNHQNNELHHERQCATETNSGCHRSCFELGKKWYNQGDDQKKYIIECEVCSTTNCNNREIIIKGKHEIKLNYSTPTQSTVKCYNCTDCYNEPEGNPVDCPSQCCYSGKGQRKCVEITNKRKAFVCDRQILCKNILNCNICQTNLCNKEPMEKPDGRPSIICYSCLNCYTIEQDTDLWNCPDQCCAMYFYTEFGGINIVRKCVTLDGMRCGNYCADHVRNDLKAADPQAVLHECKVCSHDKCNDWTVNKPTDIIASPKDIMQCYDCVGCYTVAHDTKVENCPTRCCHIAKWKEFGAYNIVRQCAKKLYDISCDDYCRDFAKQIKGLDPDAIKIICEVCKTNNCNDKEVKITKTNLAIPDEDVDDDSSPEKGIYCYHCLGCKNVTKQRTIICPETCCYTVLWTESGLTRIARRCAKIQPRSDCNFENACKPLIDNVKLNDPNGMIHTCTACEHNKCNKEPLDTNIVKSPRCYKCHNCDEIKDDTPTTYCISNCCYSYKWKRKDGRYSTKRDCARNTDKTPCEKFCGDLKKPRLLQCHVCSIEKTPETPNPPPCNNKRYEYKEPDLPDTTTKCYDCIGCYNVTPRTPTARCSSNCCYSVLWSELDVTHAARRCATLYGETCDTVCEAMQDTLESVDPSSMIHACKSCSTQKCNSKSLPIPTNRNNKIDNSIDCYECRDCDKITRTKIHLHCHSGCCYSLYLQYLDGRVGSKRKCAKVIPGQSCDTLCNYFREQYKDRAVVRTCDTCTTNKCNRKMVNRRNKRASPVCYDCIGCGSIKATTRTSEGPCCYSVVWTEFGVKTSGRFPADLKSHRNQSKVFQPCLDFCEKRVKLSDPNGLIHYCKACTGDRCNNEELEPSVEIGCYNDAMESVGCPSRCCYTVLRRIQDEAVATRSCAKVSPGRPCQKYCDYARNDIGVFSCNVCSENNCNGLLP